MADERKDRKFGPWAWNLSDADIQYLEDANGNVVLHGWCAIDADRDLIAAAPELLDALIELADCSPCQNGCSPDDMTCASSKARAAIAKATGSAHPDKETPQ